MLKSQRAARTAWVERLVHDMVRTLEVAHTATEAAHTGLEDARTASLEAARRPHEASRTSGHSAMHRQPMHTSRKQGFGREPKRALVPV